MEDEFMFNLFEIGRREFLKTGFAALGGITLVAPGASGEARQSSISSTSVPEALPAWWPQPYTVKRNEALGKLIVSTRYYTIKHDLRKGGVITKISHAHGHAENMFLRPITASVQLRRVRLRPP